MNMNEPKLRFKADDGSQFPEWEEKKIGDLFYKVNERNNGQFGKDKWISVAKMYYQDEDKVTSKLDEVIEKQKATLAAWEELKKGLLQQMFV